MVIEKQIQDEFKVAEKIIQIILLLSDKYVSQSELQFLAYLSRYPLQTESERQAYYDYYSTTYNTMTNVITSLKKKGLIYKLNNEIKPKLPLKFEGSQLKVQIHVQRDNPESSEGK